MNARILFFLLIMPLTGWAQGYARLGSDAIDYAQVTPPANLAFPRDHGPHPAFRVEWWYLTANLSAEDDTEYGIQWTLFRIAMSADPPREGWQSNQVWLAHAAATDATTHRFAETYARGGIGQAGVTSAPFEAWIDDWRLAGSTDDTGGDTGAGTGDALADLTVRARGTDFSYELRAVSDRPPVPQGDKGYSIKGAASQASYYYSQPFYEVSGTLTLDGRAIPVTGLGWLDREWSSQPLRDDQNGWDWFSLHLDSGARVMVYRLRGADGGAAYAGTWIAPDGTPEPIPEAGLAVTPLVWSEVAGREVPTEWRVAIPARGFSVDTTPLNPQSWMGTNFAYWEGPIRFEGSHAGRGYLEMTGYE
jgi:predicted secreted hydrolase